MASTEKSATTSDAAPRAGDSFEDDSHIVKKGASADQLDMRKMGKVQEVRRDFRTVSMFGFSLILMCSWEGILSTASLGLLSALGCGNGGSAGVLYTNLATWVGFIAVYASLGEMGSMAPTSGGQYHWVSEFAPRKHQKFLSYIVGWLGVLGWQTGVAFSGFLVGTQIQGLLRWHGTLLILGMLALAVLFNTFLAHSLPLLEYIVLVIHLLGFLCILIPLWVLAPKTPSAQVWTTFVNSGWSSQGLSCLVGIVASVAPLLGADAAGKFWRRTGKWDENGS
ncbi:hypothetical protein LTR78_008830 [Recurvomyces mirabilis]|uniref:Uncharacterized protein n=1 Tax=Recurvomyces mirabilis TaxID=574656 RepID=A0AAE0TSV5_9PEZI|nr:hypothetical protein LTR78_008830 [Recurvomyces mirabilis]KAK5160934.1 hypothetical protein LTS14_000727 [Recurvomyces mirabilis]